MQFCNRCIEKWRRLKHTMTVVNRMTASKSSNYDLLEEEAVGGNQKCSLYEKGDAGSMGAAAFERVRTTARSRRKGRKGMEGLLVRQDKGFIAFIQDFYVTCLKLPITHFLIGVFLVPVALGLLFTPLYLLDIDGLSFDGVTDENLNDSPVSSTKHRCSALLNVFLYALSLSTTFEGSPVAAVSPFCLLGANMNTLMAQFLFVFLSGAVFARMSQPSQPIRCAKKAIIKTDDVTVNPGEYSEEKFKVFAVRNPVAITIGPAGKATEIITKHVMMLKDGEKMSRLERLLNDLGDKTAIVFINAKKTADSLTKHLDKVGYRVTTLHEGRT